MASLFSGDNDYSTFSSVRASRKTESVSTTRTEMAARHSSLDPLIHVSASSELALIDIYPPVQYRSFRTLKNYVWSQKTKVDNGDRNAQYFSFSGISTECFRDIENHRAKLGHIRILYFADIETLIVKIPTRVHEKAHLRLGQKIMLRADRMGMQDIEIAPLGATKYTGPTASENEGDSSFINEVIRPNKGDWPSLVIEAGYSESLPRLRVDAKWWVENSNGQVRIVLLMKVDPKSKTLQIEKWIPSPTPTTRFSSRLNRLNTATLSATITIDQSQTPSTITRAPLILEFDQVFSRPPNPAVPNPAAPNPAAPNPAAPNPVAPNPAAPNPAAPNPAAPNPAAPNPAAANPAAPSEQDIVFSSQDLDDFTTQLWVGVL